jgi:DNA-binding GntR family transcriptional regulator
MLQHAQPPIGDVREVVKAKGAKDDTMEPLSASERGPPAQIAARLGRRIIQGELRPGDKLLYCTLYSSTDASVGSVRELT